MTKKKETQPEAWITIVIPRDWRLWARNNEDRLASVGAALVGALLGCVIGSF